MELTDAQQQVVDAEGNFLLLACPGSGKTRSAAARVACLVRAPGLKVAACSYTNVGAQRIATMLGVPLAPEHFLGTVHTLLLRYVVYPFANVIGAQHGPEIRGGDWPEQVVNDDPKQRMNLDHFRFDPNGNLVVCKESRFVKGTNAQILASVGPRVKARKRGMFETAGVLSADDAMWVALCILRKHPELAQAVAARFDEILIDEAQDTSELQLACIVELSKAGLASLVLVGDLEQSIFSFQGASAAGCKALAVACGLRELSLAENHRCSQKICDAASHFCARGTPDTAVGEHRDCPVDPEVALYPPADAQQAVAMFRARLDAHEIDPADAAVLARGHTFIDALSGATLKVKVDPRPERIARLAVALSHGTLTREDMRYAERVVVRCAFADKITIEQLNVDDRAEIRRAAYAFLSSLPAVTGDLRVWITAAKEALQDAAGMMVAKPATSAGMLVRSAKHHVGVAAEDVFSPPPRDLMPQTVHSIKGEDRDAVMMVVRTPHAADPTHQLDLFHAVAKGAQVAKDSEEERRVTFVALTRARRFCLVALPDTSRGREVADGCAGLGFVRV